MTNHIVLPEDKTMILDLYNNGKSISEIAYSMNFSTETVKLIIKKYLGHYTETKVTHLFDWAGNDLTETIEQKIVKTKANIQKIIDLYNDGKSPKAISSIMGREGITANDVRDILADAGVIRMPTPIFPTKPKKSTKTEKHNSAKSETYCPKDIYAFREKLKEGDIYRIRIEDYSKFNNGRLIYVNAKILKKYPNFVNTDKGNYQYFEIMCGKKINEESTSK